MNLLNNSDLVSSVRAIQGAGTDLKTTLFKSMLKGETAWKVRRDEYLMKVYSFVNTWKEYAEELQSGMKSAKGTEGIYSLKQNAVRSYLYSHYDYASILPFVDGVFKGIKKLDFKNPKDFQDFWKYTVQKAFKGRADSIGGLVEEVLNLRNDEMAPASLADAKMFEAIKHQMIFKPTDSRELYKSIEKTMEFIFASEDDGEVNYPEGEMMKVAVINAIVDYATYSLTAYATRVFAVALYVNPFIANSKDFEEAVNVIADKISYYTAMKETDELVARDFRRFPEYISRLEAFLTELGVNDEITSARDNLNIPGDQWKMSIVKNESNRFASALLTNPIKELIFGYLGMAWTSEMNIGERLHQVGDVLRECMYNSRPAYGDTATSKDEILAAIARVKPDKKTAEGFKDLAVDLVTFCGGMLSSIYSLMKQYSDHEVCEPTRYWAKTSRVVKDEKEILEMLNDLYKDVGVALLYRARAIEGKMNHINVENGVETHQLLSIKIPGGLERKGNGLSHAMATIVPVTQRIPLEVMNLYSVPYQDKLNMYDEYAKTLLPNDPFYFTEDGEEGLGAKIWNAITGFFQAIGDRARRFLGDASFKAAHDWVQKHQSELDSMKKVPPMTVKPYADNIQIPNLRSMIDFIKTHTTKEVLNDKNKFDDWEKGLKSSAGPELMTLAKVDGMTNETYTAIVKNHILYGARCPLVKTSSTEPNTVELKSEREIADRLRSWIKTVLDAPDVMSRFADQMKEFQNTTNDMKRKVADWSKELSDQTIQEAGEDPPNKIDGSGTGSSANDSGNGNSTGNTQPQQTAAQKQEEKKTTTPVTNMSNEIAKVLNETFTMINIPIYQALVQAIREEYKYIQVAWDNSKKANTNK